MNLCPDCGGPLPKAKTRPFTRCRPCQKIHRRKYTRDKVREHRRKK